MSYERPKLNTKARDFCLPDETLTQDTSQSHSDPLSIHKLSEQSNAFIDPDFFVPADPLQSPNNLYGYFYNRPQVCLSGVIYFRSRRRMHSFNEQVAKEPVSSRKGASDDFSAKYKTEICKNFEFKGKCEWGDNVS